MSRAVVLLSTAVVGLGLLTVVQQLQLRSLEDRLVRVEEQRASSPASAVGTASAGEARPSLLPAAAGRLASERPRLRQPGQGGALPSRPAGVLQQPEARSQIAEIVREEQEEVAQERMDNRRRLYMERMREQADEWAEAEGLEPVVATQLSGMLEGWFDQRFSLRSAVWEGEITRAEAREEGQALREDLRSDVEELVGAEAMGSLTETFPMLQEGGGRRGGPPF